jgi:hypothetical protein
MSETTSTPNSVPSFEPEVQVGIPPMTRREQVHALLGAFAHVPFSSEDHIRQKELEKQLEEQKHPS